MKVQKRSVTALLLKCTILHCYLNCKHCLSGLHFLVIVRIAFAWVGHMKEAALFALYTWRCIMSELQSGMLGAGTRQ